MTTRRDFIECGAAFGAAWRASEHWKLYLLSSHTEFERCFGRHQSRYHLEDYLPLLETRGRAFFNAAPVRQNIPPEILQRWQDEQTDHKTIIAFLKTQSDAAIPVIKDPVRIRPVDLHEYDFLKEAAYV